MHNPFDDNDFPGHHWPEHPDPHAPHSGWDLDPHADFSDPGDPHSGLSHPENWNPPSLGDGAPDPHENFHGSEHLPLDSHPGDPTDPHCPEAGLHSPHFLNWESHDPGGALSSEPVGDIHASSPLHFASDPSSGHPHIHLNDNGDVYLDDHGQIGEVQGHNIYNSGHWECGYWTTEGKVYDHFDHLVGWVAPDGHVYAKGQESDPEVYQTNSGVAGGAAYLLLVWCGGQTHV